MDEQVDLKISIGTKASQEGINKLNKTLDQTEKSTHDIGRTGTKQFDAVSKSIAGATAQLTAFFSVGAAAGGFAYSIHAASQFETALIGVAKTTGLAGASLRGLSSDISQLSRIVPVTTSEMLALGQSAGQLGVKGRDNIVKFTDTIAKLGRASNLAGDEAATTLARILNVTGESIGSVDTFASVIVSLGNNVAATESEIARITNEIARATSTFGVASAEAAALGAALVSLGARAESSGSSVGRVFQEIQNRVAVGGDELRNFAAALEINAQELVDTFNEDKIAGFNLFLEAIRDLGAEKAGAVLKELNLGGLEIIKTMTPLANNIELYRKTQALANKEVENAVALQNEFNAAIKTFDAQSIVFKNNLNAIAKAFGDQFLDTFTESLEEASVSLNVFISDTKEFQKVIENTVGAVKLLGSLLATGGAFYAAAVVLPPVIAASTSALLNFQIALAITRSAGIAFSASMIPLNASLLGVSVSARIAAGSLTAMNLSLGIAGAAFAGFQVGTYLSTLDAVRGTTIALTNTIVSNFLSIKKEFELFDSFLSSLFKSDEENAAIVAEINERYAEQEKQLAATTAAQYEKIFATEEESDAVISLREEIEELKRELADKKAEEEAKKGIFQLTEEYQNLLDAVFPLKKLQRDYEKDVSNLTKIFKGQGKSVEELNKALELLKNNYAELFPEIQAYNDYLSLIIAQGEEQYNQIISLTEAMLPLKTSQKEYTEQVKLLEIAHDAGHITAAEFAIALHNLKKAHIELFPEVQKQQEAADELATSWEKAMERIDEAFADAWEGAFDSFEDFSEAIQDSFKKLMAELAHQAITKPILIQLGVGGSAGVAGSAGGGIIGYAVSGLASSALASLGISGGIGSLGGSGAIGAIGNTFGIGSQTQFVQLSGQGGLTSDLGSGGGFTFNPVDFAKGLGAGIAGASIGNKIGTSLTGKEANSGWATTAGSVIGSFWGPIGTFVGSAVGGFLDSLFGSENRPPQFNIGPTSRDVKELFDGANLEKTVESALGKVRFRTESDFAKGLNQTQIDQIFSVFDSFAELENQIAATLTEAKASDVKSALSRQALQSSDNGSRDFTQFFIDRFNILFDAVGGEIDESFDEILQVTTGTSAQIASQLAAITDAAIAAGNAQGDFKTYIDSLDRVSVSAVNSGRNLITVNGILKQLGLVTFDLSKSGADAVSSILETAGGLEQFIAVVSDIGSVLSTVSTSIFGSLDDRIDAELDRLDTINDLAKDLYKVELDRFRDSLRAAERLSAAYDSIASVGALPADNLQSQKTKLDSLFQQAISGNADAAAEFADFAPTFIATARDFYASSSEFKDIQKSVLANLEALENQFSGVSGPGDFQEVTTSELLETLFAELAEKQAQQRQAEIATFVQGISQLSIATGQDIDTLLAGLGIKIDDVGLLLGEGNTTLQGVFNSLDSNGDLAISIAELKTAGILDAEKIVSAIDLNKDGVISKSELIISALGPDGAVADLLKQIDSTATINASSIISSLDENMDGQLTVQDLWAIDGYHSNLIVAGLDSNKDGIISSVELVSNALTSGGAVYTLLTQIGFKTSSVYDAIKLLDFNLDGGLSYDELVSANVAGAAGIITALDINKDGVVSAVELVSGSLTSGGEAYALLQALGLSTDSVKTAVDSLDSNLDGIITYQELVDANIAGAQGIITAIDTNKNGVIDSNELISGLLSEGGASYNLLKEISDSITTINGSSAASLLTLIDSNADQKLSLSELVTYGFSMKEADDIISKLDLNKDGVLRIEELTKSTLSAFSKLDDNKDELVSLNELLKAGISITEGSSLIAAIDTNYDGFVSLGELITALLSPGSAAIQGLQAIANNTASNSVTVNVDGQGNTTVETTTGPQVDITSGINAGTYFSGSGIGATDPDKPKEFAAGGIVTRPTYALIGEAGQSEAVVPLDDFSAQIYLVVEAVNRLSSITREVVAAIDYHGELSADQREELKLKITETNDDLIDAIGTRKSTKGIVA